LLLRATLLSGILIFLFYGLSFSHSKEFQKEYWITISWDEKGQSLKNEPYNLVNLEYEQTKEIAVGESNHDSKLRLESENALKLVVERSKGQITLRAGVEKWRSLCAKYFPEQVNNCLRVMQAESGGNQYSVSRTSDFGLMQINYPTWGHFFQVSKEQLFDSETNMHCARIIYNRSGSWRPWVGAKKIGLI